MDEKDITTIPAGDTTTRGNGEPPPYDITLIVLTSIYSILFFIVIVVPPILVNDKKGDVWTDLGSVVAIVIFCGGASLILAIVITCIAGCRWGRLSTMMKLMSLYPVVSFVIGFVFFILVVAIASKESADSFDGTICYNETGGLLEECIGIVNVTESEGAKL
jgi:hypothetical protein